ncbi:MAG: Eco57I restriction-modification methylase domain-containing protein [Candidatus Brocadiia bacterium]
MPLDFSRMRNLVENFDFERIFIEELGWDRLTATLSIEIDDHHHELTAVAEKRGMVVLLSNCDDDGRIPDYSTRRKLDRRIAKRHHEHIVIYTDPDETTQIWQWVKRQPGKPDQSREHRYQTNQPGDALIQKLQTIQFTLDEEEEIGLPDVTTRVQAAFDVEKVTKKFYDHFESEHEKFLGFIEGIPDEELERWYASVMLNRLMFIYFVQKKGFLDDDPDYLSNKLEESKGRGQNLYYRDFLCPLFFKGFARPESDRSSETNNLLGEVPYLNGGIFQKHEVEQQHGKEIHVPDRAFERIFEFFDQYRWHLDERPLRKDNEINPDVLGYIFEKYINQKEMGAYYTKEDITGYIGRNTVIPRIFDKVQDQCRVAFEGEHSVWDLLQENPDRYIYDAMKKGTELELPPEVAAGIDDVSQRSEWNKPASDEYALPTEIWREVVDRRQRYQEIHDKLTAGEVRDINDLITYNLDIQQFAQDVVENCEGPDLLRAFWRTIAGRQPRKSNEKFYRGITVLDPACGSGAFLFAALNILEPLYEGCLDRMQAFVGELEESPGEHDPRTYEDFRDVLERIDRHPNRRYFILKSVVLNNLYGVDIMEEAVEICKLRLFLKLAAQVDTAEKIEPLPDIDFNIRAGNTLVGFTSLDEVRDTVKGLGFEQEQVNEIEEEARFADRKFKMFQLMQTQQGMNSEAFRRSKRELSEQLKSLEDKLDKHLAGEYDIDPEEEAAFQSWKSTHDPFHWLVDFFGIVKNGGFDVVIGNPPYVEYSQIKKTYKIRDYKTTKCGNLYAYMMERSIHLLPRRGRFGMIVQLPVICSTRMQKIQNYLRSNCSPNWFANFDDRPGRLFDGLEHIRASIVLAKKESHANDSCFRTTTYNRWYTENRPFLFESLKFKVTEDMKLRGSIPKIGCETGKNVMDKLLALPNLKTYIDDQGEYVAYYHNAPQYWVRATNFVPYFWNERDGHSKSSHVKELKFNCPDNRDIVTAVLNSSLFYFWFVKVSNCRDLTARDVKRFGVPLERLSDKETKRLVTTTELLMSDYKENSTRKECRYATTGKVAYDEFHPGLSKTIMDKIDRLLAEPYGMNSQEIDFVSNYDIKYRLGFDTLNSEECDE